MAAELYSRRPPQRCASRVLSAVLALLALAECQTNNATETAQNRQRLREAALRAPRSPIEMELVVARHGERDMSWLAKIPDFYHVTIYNKGGTKHPMPKPPKGRYWDVVDLQNVGREANTFAEHLVRRYDSLAAYTIFSQADPFVHNMHYLELLKTPALLGSVQTMSRVYKRDGDQRFRTPGEVVEKMSKHPWYRSERLSLRTLNSVWYHDEGTVSIHNNYLRQHQLERGTNLVHHHFSLMGLPDWIPEELEVGSFAFGGLVGFERSRALQHPKKCYELLLQTTKESKQSSNAWLIERIWVMLFAGPEFRDF